MSPPSPAPPERSQELICSNGVRLTGADAIAAFSKMFEARDEVVAYCDEAEATGLKFDPAEVARVHRRAFRSRGIGHLLSSPATKASATAAPVRMPAVRNSGRARRQSTNTRSRGSRRSSSGGGDPGSGDDPSEPPGDGDPPSRDPRKLLPDLEHYLARLGPLGIEREFLIDEISYLGHPREIVSVGITMLVAERKARRGRGQNDVDTIWATHQARAAA